MIDFIQQLKAFDYRSQEILTPNAIAIYFKLFMMNNRRNWAEWIETTDSRLSLETGIKRRESIFNAVNLLKQHGFIDCERGGKHKPSRYKIIPLLNSAINSAIDSAITSGINSAITSAIDSAITSAIDSDINKHINNKQDKHDKQSTRKRVDVFAGESENVQEALRAFVEMRAKMRKPMTDKAKELLLKKLNDFSGGDDSMKVHLLEQSIEHGWQSVYPSNEKEGQRGRNTGYSRTNKRSPEDEVRKWENQPDGWRTDLPI